METKRVVLVFCFTVTFAIAVGCQAEVPIPTETPTLAQLPEGCPPDCSYADLSEAKLHEAKLSGADLRGTVLRRADLRGADLNQADLRGANLQGANLQSARLIGTDLRGANLEMADLSEADLTEANLNGARLSRVNLSGANLHMADLRSTQTAMRLANLRGTRIDDTTQIDDKWRLVWEIVNQGAEGRDLRGVDLRQADLNGADLNGANLSGAYLYRAELSGANLRGANLNGARLPGGVLTEADLRGADLRGGRLHMANLSEADLSEADLSENDMSFADLSGAILTGANLSGADLSGVMYDNTTIWPANFDPLEADAASQTPLPIPTPSPSTPYESQELKANCLELLDSQTLSFPTYHVQGLAVTEDIYYVSAVDKENNRGWLFKIARESLALMEQQELTAGALVHPGGIQVDGDYLWVPSAEYDRDGPTRISALDLQSLEVSRAFDVDDHISLIASDGTDRLYGTNWDSAHFYVWDWDGNLIERVVSPTDVAYQDCEFVDPYLMCGGTKNHGSYGTIDFIAPASWTLVNRIEVGQTNRGHRLTREGLSFFGGGVYLLPEDGPDSEILIYRLCRNP